MAKVDSQGNPVGSGGVRQATSTPSSGGGGGGSGIAIGATKPGASLGNGYVEILKWNGTAWVVAGYDYDRTPEPDSGSGSSGPGPQAYGATESGFLASLDLENRQLNEQIRSNTQRLDEIRLQEEAAGGRLNTQLAAERDRLNDQLAVTREQLAENKRQFNEELTYKRSYDDRSLGLTERDVALRELTGERNYGLSQREQDLAELTGERSYEVSLANLDLQGQQLAINARKNELDHEVDLGRLSVEQARVQLEGEIAQGQLQLGRERLQVEREGLALQGELGRGDLALREKLGLGELDISRQRLGLDTELGRGELAVRRQEEMRQLAATYSDQFGKDPVRQALFSLGLKGGMSPQEAAFRSLGLATGGGGSIRPMAGEQAPPQQQGILTGEAGPEVVTQTPEGDVQVIPIRGAAAGGGNFNLRPQRRSVMSRWQQGRQSAQPRLGGQPEVQQPTPEVVATPAAQPVPEVVQPPQADPNAYNFNEDTRPRGALSYGGEGQPYQRPQPGEAPQPMATQQVTQQQPALTRPGEAVPAPAPVLGLQRPGEVAPPEPYRIPIVARAASGGTFNIKPSYSGVRDPLRARRERLAAAKAAPVPAPAPAPDIPQTQGPSTGAGATQPYTPSYDPNNSGWDSILRDIQANADATAKTTGDTLGRALGVQGITIDKNKGVLGLPTAQKAARAYLEAGIPVQNLITSGYSVGGEYGGTPAEEFLRQIMDVTPRGALQY